MTPTERRLCQIAHVMAWKRRRRAKARALLNPQPTAEKM